ncbi:MAG: DUF417 family protein [Patescibacteria group bacterium]
MSHYFSSVNLLKLSLAVVFVWFGALKLLDVSPVAGIIAAATPMIIEYHWLFYALALFEIALGVGLFIPRVERLAAWTMVAHLFFATFAVLFSPLAFDGGFPYLSIAGEFVVKNFVLITGALVVASRNE